MWEPLWSDLPATDDVEKIENREIEQNRKGLNRAISAVSTPGFSVHRPQSNVPTPAVVVFPGGGFLHLAIDKEGSDVAEFLNASGIAAIVVKYRTWQPSPEELKAMMEFFQATAEERASMTRGEPKGREEAIKQALGDARRAVRIVRTRAADWNIDPNRIGVLGFSAGGYLAAAVAMDHDPGDGSSDDVVERASSRPDFAGMIYAAIDKDEMTESAVRSMPPSFFVHAADDPLVNPDETTLYMYKKMRSLGLAAELHLYQQGGHGFGLGVRGGAVAGWPAGFVAWIREISATRENQSTD